jgi:ABC-type Na+ efflux pump permease subunit
VNIWLLAEKEIRLLLRDRLAAVILLLMPLLFILVLGPLVGEGFGEKPDDRLRVSLVDLDEGPCGLEGHEKWSQVVLKDLSETAGIRIEIVPGLEAAQALIAGHKRPAILVFKKDFSREVNRCSFIKDGINPFHRDGVYLDKVDAELLIDRTQPGASAIIDQVAQVTLLRVLLPWMIGRAFERLSDPAFIELLGNQVRLPVPQGAELLFKLRGIKLEDGKASLNQALEVAAPDEKALRAYRARVGEGVKESLQKQFENYNLTGKTWADLTRSRQKGEGGAEISAYVNREGAGLLARGAQRYQILVPGFTVMFAFFLVLNVGWVFVGERTQGTLRRLRAAPLTRGELLLGKLVPYFLLSLGQGCFLLLAGRLLFDMRWGPETWSLTRQVAWLLPVVFCTSLAAMGLALLVAAVARTEIQVALFGAVPVLVLALLGGCVLPREMMPEQVQWLTLLTPQGWALEAYRELLAADPAYIPNGMIVARACGVLAAFGAGFVVLAWGFLRLD